MTKRKRGSALNNKAFAKKAGKGLVWGHVRRLLKKDRPTIRDVLDRWKTHEQFGAEAKAAFPNAAHRSGKRQWASMLRRVRNDKRPASTEYISRHFTTQGGLGGVAAKIGESAEGGVAGVAAGVATLVGQRAYDNWRRYQDEKKHHPRSGSGHAYVPPGGAFMAPLPSPPDDWADQVRVDLGDLKASLDRADAASGSDLKLPDPRGSDIPPSSDFYRDHGMAIRGIGDVITDNVRFANWLNDHLEGVGVSPADELAGEVGWDGSRIADTGWISEENWNRIARTYLGVAGGAALVAHLVRRFRRGGGPGDDGGGVQLPPGADDGGGSGSGSGCPPLYPMPKKYGYAPGSRSRTKRHAGAGTRASVHHASSIDMPTGPSSHETGGDEGHGHNPHAPGPHMGGQIQQQQSANTNMIEEHGNKGAAHAHGSGKQKVETQAHPKNEEDEFIGDRPSIPDPVDDDDDDLNQPPKKHHRGPPREDVDIEDPTYHTPGGAFREEPIVAPAQPHDARRPGDRKAAEPGGVTGNKGARDARENLTYPQVDPKPGQLREDLHFRAMLPEMRDDALVRPVGSAQTHKDQFILFDYHQRDNEFASLGDQLDDDFYQQRLREDAIRYKAPLNKMPLEFKGSHTGLKPGDDHLGGYGAQPRPPKLAQYLREEFVAANRGMIDNVALKTVRGLHSYDNAWMWGGVNDGTYFPEPLKGQMHDQMRENINFGKSQFIAPGPVAPVERLTNFDLPITNPFARDIYHNRNRNHWDTLTINGSYPWSV